MPALSASTALLLSRFTLYFSNQERASSGGGEEQSSNVILLGFDTKDGFYRIWDVSKSPTKGIIQVRGIYFNKDRFPLKLDNVRGDGILSRPSPRSLTM